ncbi:MAG: metallophosphoesterase [Fimbriimonadaceae bacterium]|nr:metallophosphoesterase [Fimbriimonadaceae bacterium]
MTRRDLLAYAGAGLLLPRDISLKSGHPSRCLRVAFITDVHVQPEYGAERALVRCLEHFQQLADPPQLVINGGDSVMDAFGATADRATVEWNLFGKVLKQSLRTPILHTIGNHDIFGWGTGERDRTNPRFGKRWAMDTLQLESPYYVVDRDPWRFIVLDSTVRNGDKYLARLDDLQYEWLEATLANTRKDQFIVIVSHIPIISVTPFFDGSDKVPDQWQFSGGWMHTDARRLKNLFAKHPQVRLALSGHMHLVDRINYNGVTYFCGGAVSSGWWEGVNQECDYGYTIVDLYTDGTSDTRYVPYGWQTVRESMVARGQQAATAE